MSVMKYKDPNTNKWISIFGGGGAGGEADTAEKLETPRNINGVPFDGTEDITISGFHAGTSAPSNTKLLWIDTTATTGGLKYYNGTDWVTVPVRFS